MAGLLRGVKVIESAMLFWPARGAHWVVTNALVGE